MEERQKRMIIALIISTIVASVVTLLVYDNAYKETPCWQKDLTADQVMRDSMLLGGAPECPPEKPDVSYEFLSAVFVVCLVGLTLVLYFGIDYLQKQLKK